MTNSKEVNLSIDSRIISHLGEALIDNEKVALLELIKNASDADANICTVVIDTTYQSKYGQGRIVIEDDGSGMNPFIIENGFLRIATSIKQKYQKISPKFNRLAQGNKGIGRLALNQLGEYLSVATKLDTYAPFLPLNKKSPYQINGKGFFVAKVVYVCKLVDTIKSRQGFAPCMFIQFLNSSSWHLYCWHDSNVSS